MLSRAEKQIIRQKNACFTSIKEVKGKPVTDNGKPFIIPTYPEIFAQAMSEIQALGFSNIYRTSPNKANCDESIEFNHDFVDFYIHIS